MIFGFCRRQSPCQRRLLTPARPLRFLSNYSLRYPDFNSVARIKAVTGSWSSLAGSGLIQLILAQRRAERLNGTHNSNTRALLRGPQCHLPIVGVLNTYSPAAICSHPPIVTHLKSFGFISQGQVRLLSNRMASSQVKPASGMAAQLGFSNHCSLWNPDYGSKFLMVAADTGENTKLRESFPQH